MLQLRRTGPPCQRMPAAAAAQEVPFLPECFSHGRQLSKQSTAVLPRVSGNSDLAEGRGRGTEPRPPAHRALRLNDSGMQLNANQKVFPHWNAAYRTNYLRFIFNKTAKKKCYFHTGVICCSDNSAFDWLLRDTATSETQRLVRFSFFLSAIIFLTF